MELHKFIHEAPLISNYAGLFELWGSVKLAHRILCHAIFSTRLHKFLNQPLVYYGAEFCNWLRRFLWGHIFRGRHHGARPWYWLNVNDYGELSKGVAVSNMMSDIGKLFITQSLKMSVVLHSFVRTFLWCIYISCYFAYSELQCWSSVAPHRDKPSGTHRGVWQLGNFSIRRIAEGTDGQRRRV